MRQNLRTVEVDFMRGAVPNLNEADLAGGGALDRAENVDFNRKFRTISKMNGVSQRSPDLGNAVASLHYFEYSTLYGADAREVLALEGGQLHRIDSPSSTTVMGAGFNDEHLSAVTYNDRIHFASKNNDPKKYDGAAVRTWGVYGPGSEPTEVYTFDSASGWTANATNSVLANTTIKKRGTGSLALYKSDATVINVVAENSTVSISTTGGGTYVWCFLPHGSYDALADANAVVVMLTTATFTDATEWFFDKRDLFPGWNLLYLDPLDGVITGAGAPNPVLGVRLTVNASTIAQTLEAEFDFMYTVPVGTLSAAVGAAGALTGTYRYKVTFVTKYGVESNAGPASTGVILTADRADLTNIPVSSDTQVIARRLYRDVGGSAVFEFLHEIGDNSTTTYTDNDAGPLAATLPPEAASTTNDASPPERMICVTAWRGHVFGINAARPIELNISNGADPETWPLVSTLAFQESLTALAVHPAGLLAFTSDKAYLLDGFGTTADPFVANEVNAEIGSNHWLSVAVVRDGVVTHHEGRLYLLGAAYRDSGLDNPWLLNARMLRSDQSLWRPSIVVADRVRDRILLAMPTAPDGSEYNALHALNFTSVAISQVTGDGPGINPQDIRNGIQSTILNPFSAFKSFAVVENANDESELWVGLADGYVMCMANQAGDNGYQWQSSGSPATLTTVIAFMVPLHQQPGGRGDIRYLEVDCEGESGAVWATQITYYDSPMRTTSLGGPASFNVDGSKSTVTAIPRGARGSIAYVAMTNTTAFRSTISRIRANVIPRFAPRGVRA